MQFHFGMPAYTIMMCQLCGTQCGVRFPCTGCSALFYCSVKHRRIHSQSHELEECTRMKLQVQDSKDLELPWFPWWSAVNNQETFKEATQRCISNTSPKSEQLNAVCLLLESTGYHRRGLWKHVCRCSQAESVAQHAHLAGEGSCAQRGDSTIANGGCGQAPSCLSDTSMPSLSGWFLDPVFLPTSRSCIDEVCASRPLNSYVPAASPPSLPASAGQQGMALRQTGDMSKVQTNGRPSRQPLLSWQDYYQAGGLPAESPAALLLHHVLTLYLGLETVNGMMQGGLFSSSNGLATEQDGSESHPAAKQQKREEASSPGCFSPNHDAGDRTRLEAGTVALHVLYLGPQEELSTLPVLTELARLLPSHIRLSIHFVGPDVPSAWHGSETELRLDAQADPSAPATSSCQEAALRDAFESGLCSVRASSLRGSSQAVAPGNASESSLCRGCGPEVARTGAPSCAAGSLGPCPGSQGGCLLPDDILYSTSWQDWMNKAMKKTDHDSSNSRGSGSSSSSSRSISEVHFSTSEAQEDTSRAPGTHQSLPCAATPCSPAAGHVKLSFWQGHLHDVCGDLALMYSLSKLNSVVYAPNAGLAAYPSWMPTMSALMSHTRQMGPGSLPPDVADGLHQRISTPEAAAAAERLRGISCVVTDFCSEALHQGRAMLEAVCHAPRGLPLLVNPFRQPLWQTSHGNALPALSNGFMMVMPPS